MEEIKKIIRGFTNSLRDIKDSDMDFIIFFVSVFSYLITFGTVPIGKV